MEPTSTSDASIRADIGLLKYCYINSFRFDEIFKIDYSGASPIYKWNQISFKGDRVRLYVNPNCPYEIPSGATVSLASGSNTTSYNFDYSPLLFYDDKSGKYKKAAQDLCSKNVSYSLLRTNPKLSGNIRVVVENIKDASGVHTSTQSMYLDTFKVSPALSKKRYRKQKVSPNDKYASNVQRVFSSLPLKDMYHVSDACYELFGLKTDYGQQYYTEYEYGVRTNEDRLYQQNFSFLAPLCIKNVIPDFFLIFRVDGPVDVSIYHDVSAGKDGESRVRSISDSSLFQKYLETGTLVESFDMRKHTALGKYVRSILSDAKDTVGDIYIPFDKSTDTIFNGISIKKGIVAKIHESPYDVIPCTGNQTSVDNYYTEGFERNGILKDNLINFTFMFDDTDSSVENFTINRYYGLYVKINEQAGTYYCINGDTSNGFYIIDSSKNRMSRSSGMFLDPTKEKRLLYCMDSPTECQRLTAESIEYDPAFEDYVNNPYKNISRCDVSAVEKPSETMDSFATITINYPLNPGDTIRVVDSSNLVVYEAIASNDASLRSWNANDSSYMIGNCATTFEDVPYVYTDTVSGSKISKTASWTIKSVPFYCPYDNIDDSSSEIDGDISAEVERISHAFMKMDSSTIGIYSYDSSSIAFYGAEGLSDSSSSLWIERISSTCKNSFAEKYSYEDNVIVTAYSEIEMPQNEFDPDAIPASRTETGFIPHGFEILGKRTYYAIKFMELDSSKMYSISKASASEIDALTLCMVDSSYANYTSRNYRLLNYFDFTCFYDGDSVSSLSDAGKSLFSVTQPNIVPSFTNPQNYIISAPFHSDSSKDSLSTIGSAINLYSVYPLKIGLAGIFPVRDLDMYINDASTAIFNDGSTTAADAGIWSNDVTYKSTKKKTRRGEFEYFRNYVSLRDASTYAAFTASDISACYNGSRRADTPILSPTICKWVNYSSTIYPFQYFATYNNRFNSFADGSSAITFDSYGISGDSSVMYYFYDNTGFDLTNYVVDSDSSLIQMRNKLIKDGDVGTIASKNSSVYSVAYSMGSNRLDIMAYGTKIEISSLDMNKVNVSDFNGYSVEIYPVNNINPKYNSPIEIMVNKQTENILIGWYTGKSVDVSNAISNSSAYPNRILMTSGTLDDEKIDSGTTTLSISNVDTSVADVSGTFFSGVNINQIDAYSRYDDFTANLAGSTLSNRTISSSINSISIDETLDISTSEISDASLFRLSNYYKTYLFISSPTGEANGETHYTTTDDEFFNSLRHLKNGIGLPISLYIKNGTDTIHYYSSDVLSMKIVDPIPLDASMLQDVSASTNASTGTVSYSWNAMRQYPTVFEPNATDILNFSNSPSSAYITDGMVDASGVTGYSYFNANIWIESVGSIQQIWYSKRVDASNLDFCNPDASTYRLGLDVFKNYSPMMSPWDSSFNRKYSSSGSMSVWGGYKNCCETPSFFSSRGIMLRDSSANGRTFYITKWTDVFEEQTTNYYKEDQDVINKKLIKIDINKNVLNTLLSKKGVIYNWIYVPSDDIDDNSKSEYVKNSIMSLYSINNKAKFTFYRMKNISGLSKNFVDYSESYSLDRRYEFGEITNIDSTITYENNHYYINIYVPASNDYLYTATYKMELRNETISE